jgi:hypothetical protein
MTVKKPVAQYPDMGQCMDAASDAEGKMGTDLFKPQYISYDCTFAFTWPWPPGRESE